MTSIIIHGPDENQINDYVETSLISHDQTVLVLKPENTSITIQQIHTLHKQLSITARSTRTIWIQNAHLATTPAQNALLKTLEEPPNNTSFILTTTNLNQLLPTIISRCITKKIGKTLNIKDQKILSFLKKVLTQNHGKRMISAKDLPKKREEALDWINTLIQSLQTTLQQTSNPKNLQTISKILKPALTTQQHLKTNVNVSIALESFLLNLPQAK